MTITKERVTEIIQYESRGQLAALVTPEEVGAMAMKLALLQAAGERMLDLFADGKAMSRFDWGQAFLRAEDIRELNEAPFVMGTALRA